MDIQQTWASFVQKSNFSNVTKAIEVAQIFRPEMAQYCEFIQGPGGTPIGFMCRGEDHAFTDRAEILMRQWQAPEEQIMHYLSMAEMFEHKRSFLKLEWHHRTNSKQIEHLVAFYFRRRPSVKEWLNYLQIIGIDRAILNTMALLADTLEKESIHFVSGAIRPSLPIRHKLYFSQYVKPASYAAVLRRLLQVMNFFEIDPISLARLVQYHSALVPPDRITTIFVSFSFTTTEIIPSVKIDYPNVPFKICPSLVDEKQRQLIAAEARRIITMLNVTDLSYLGVRLYQAKPPTIKYYVDYEGGISNSNHMDKLKNSVDN